MARGVVGRSQPAHDSADGGHLFSQPRGGSADHRRVRATRDAPEILRVRSQARGVEARAWRRGSVMGRRDLLVWPPSSYDYRYDRRGRLLRRRVLVRVASWRLPRSVPADGERLRRVIDGSLWRHRRLSRSSASGGRVDIMTRRQLLSLPMLSASGRFLAGQEPRGMASRQVKPKPRGKSSGLPFDASFANVADAAGLHAPVVYGGIERNDYIVESMGCGAAFIDYDNDGWIDMVMLTGRRFQNSPADAIIRLYRNNRNGTFTDVTKTSGLGRSVWACGITVGDYN